MREEIAAAVIFLTRLVKTNAKLTQGQVDDFSRQLSTILVDRFQNHWYCDEPQKGQGYRCIRPNDPWIMQAAIDSGLEYKDLNMPPELTIWVDPREVCCRFGENKGSWYTLFKDGKEDQRVMNPTIEKVLSQSQLVNRNRPFEVTRSNNLRVGSSSPPSGARAHHHHGNVNSSNVRNFNHNHNNNLIKFKRFNQTKFRSQQGPPKGIGPAHHSHSTSPTSFAAKSGPRGYSPSGSPAGKPFVKSARAQFQQKMTSTMRNDRYHWVRGADLVKA